jgi:four helix bundle protein
MEVKHFKQLYVWQRAMELVEEVYKITKELSSDERFGLVSQIRRSSISIPSNIAEGSRRKTRDFVRFLNTADGSASELETQLLLSAKLYQGIDCKRALSLLQEVQKMLGAMIVSLVRNL